VHIQAAPGGFRHERIHFRRREEQLTGPSGAGVGFGERGGLGGNFDHPIGEDLETGDGQIADTLVFGA
jgi:hypothetical protein